MEPNGELAGAAEAEPHVRRMRVQEPNGSGTRGSILLMGSVTVTDPVPELFGTHAYAAAKGATTALMTAMAATYLADRIRVNAVAPSLTRTPMARRAAGDERILAFAREKQPLAGEMLDPDEVAHAAVLCPSFYETRVVRNPSAWERAIAALRSRVIGLLQGA